MDLGLSLVPTAHVYDIDGRIFYAWCALDTLAFPVIFKHIASIQSYDPLTRSRIYLRVRPELVEKIEPESTVVSFTTCNIDIANVRSSFCNSVNFFSSAQTAATWARSHPEITFYSVREVFQALKHIHLDKYSDTMLEACEERRCC